MTKSIHSHQTGLAGFQPGKALQDEVLAERELEVERKTFRLSHRRNARGEILRIDELRGSVRNTVIIPVTGNAIEAFLDLIEDMIPSPEVPPTA